MGGAQQIYKSHTGDNFTSSCNFFDKIAVKICPKIFMLNKNFGKHLHTCFEIAIETFVYFRSVAGPMGRFAVLKTVSRLQRRMGLRKKWPSKSWHDPFSLPSTPRGLTGNSKCSNICSMKT